MEKNSYQNILIEKHGKIGYIILNKPEKKNAIDTQMMTDLRSCVEQFEVDDDISVIILKGAGHSFCSGGDLSAQASGTGQKSDVSKSRNSFKQLAKAISAMQNCDKPIIAMVESYAIGGGFSIALACDIIIAAEDAKMASNFLHLGLSPEMGSLLFLPLTCGMFRAKDLWYTGRRLTATEAYDLGIASYVYPNDQIEEKTLEYAEMIAALPGLPVRIMKRVTNSTIYSQLEAVLSAESQNSPFCMQSAECKEYLAANFRKKK